MKYTDYFSNFYMGRSSGGILGHKSKEKIPEYFFKAALLEEYYDLLPTSNSAYGKWFDGIRKPEGVIWGTVVSHFDEDGTFFGSFYSEAPDEQTDQRKVADDPGTAIPGVYLHTGS
jgi:hypothetical protein